MNTWEDELPKVVRFRINFGSVAVTWADEKGFRGYQVEDGSSAGVGYKSSAMLFNVRQIDFSPIIGALSQALSKSPKQSLRRQAIQQVKFVLEKMEVELMNQSVAAE